MGTRASGAGAGRHSGVRSAQQAAQLRVAPAGRRSVWTVTGRTPGIHDNLGFATIVVHRENGLWSDGSRGRSTTDPRRPTVVTPQTV